MENGFYRCIEAELASMIICVEGYATIAEREV